MGLSETILAAMIGALATVTTALFQLYTSFKHSRSKSVETRSKRGSTMRSVLAVLALMVASAAGGFLYSEFIKQRSGEDMRAMRGELQEMRALIASGRDAVKAQADHVAEQVAEQMETAQQPGGAVSMPASMERVSERVESVVYVPACRASSPTDACGEQDAQRIALCGTIPAYARVDQIELFAQPDAMQHPWDRHQVTFEQDLGGARFTGKSFEYAQGAELKAVCVNFMQWSSEHPHIARIVVQFGFGTAPAAVPVDERSAEPSPLQMQPTQVPAVIAADSLHPLPATAAFSGPTSVQ
jgi:hypothetical protein